MTCLTDGTLRAQLDGELSEAESVEVNRHLASCPDCHHRAEGVALQAERVRGALAALAPLPAESSADAGIALARFKARQRTAEPEAPSLISRLFGKLFDRRLRPAWGALAVVAVVIAFLSFAPVRSWGQKILAMLRVQQITVVPVDLEALNRPAGEGRLGKTIGQLLSDNVVVTMKPGEPQSAADAEEASQRAAFRVRLLGNRADQPRLRVQGETALHMTVNRERLQTILDEAGRSDLQLPAALEGATVAVHVPSLVLAQYGHCSNSSSNDASSPQAGDANSCIDLAQVPSPTVSVPPDLDMAQLAEVGLQLGGMSAEDAHAFCQTVDWTSTLVLGIPRGISYQTVDVEGVQGTLIDLPRRGKRRSTGYTLLWVRNGIIYALTGDGSSANAVPLAESLN